MFSHTTPAVLSCTKSLLPCKTQELGVGLERTAFVAARRPKAHGMSKKDEISAMRLGLSMEPDEKMHVEILMKEPTS